MTDPMRNQIRSLIATIVEDVADPIPFEDVQAMTPTRAPGPRIAVAAAAVVIGVIGITALVFGEGPTDPVTDSDPAESAPTTETTMTPDPTEPSQTTTPTSAPIDDADTADQLAPGWEALGRLDAPRYHATTVDTGTELLVFGGGDDPYTGPEERGFSAIWSGIAIDHVSGTVRNLPPSPMCESGIPAGVWTESEFVMWRAGASSVDRDDCPDAAAYSPTSDSWRTLHSEFFAAAGSQTTWSGEELVSAAAGMALRISDGNIRTIESVRDSEMFTGSDVHSPPTMHSTGEEILVLGSDGVIRLDIASGQVVDGPEPPIPDRARSSTWTGSELLAVNYDMAAATFDPVAGRWTEAPSLPLRFYECGPVAVAGGGLAFVWSCAGIGLWDGSGDWKLLPLPMLEDGLFGTFAAGDGYLYQIGASVHRYRIPDMIDGETSQPPFFPIGVQFFETPAGWTVVGTFRESGSDATGTRDSVGIELSGPEGIRCRIASTYAGMNRYVAAPTESAELTRSLDGATIPVGQTPRGPNGLAYVVIADSNGSDILEAACPDLDNARLLAANLWSPWDPPDTLPPGVANDGVCDTELAVDAIPDEDEIRIVVQLELIETSPCQVRAPLIVDLWPPGSDFQPLGIEGNHGETLLEHRLTPEDPYLVVTYAWRNWCEDQMLSIGVRVEDQVEAFAGTHSAPCITPAEPSRISVIDIQGPTSQPTLIP